jgi:hypothetical protein
MDFRAGDVIERPGPAGTRHRAVVAGTDGFGRLVVIHNAKNSFVKYDVFDVFAAGLPVSLISRSARNWYEQQQIVNRAKSHLGKQYDLLKFNCDHLVTYAQTGVASSPQLKTGFGVILLVSVLGGLALASSRA